MSDQEIIDDAIERFRESQDGSDYNRETAEEDIRFARLADQWPETIRLQREKEGRPILTINKLPSFIRQVVNNARQNKPSIVVKPNDNSADPDTADVINGLVRAIERNSNADIAYDTGCDHQVSGGFGFFRIGIEDVGETFEKEIRIERIFNPFMVHWDVSSTEFDASDWEYGFVSEFMGEDEFEEKYPGKQKTDFETNRRIWHEQFVGEGNKIQVAEYWLREDQKYKLLGLNNGDVLRQDKIIEAAKELLADLGMDAKGMSVEELIGLYLDFTETQVTREREGVGKKVTRRIISGAEVLEETLWPGSTIPICPVWGEEIALDGRRYFRSMVRDAVDIQRMFNYHRSASTELLSLAPRAPFIGPKGFVGKDKSKWDSANTRSHGYLEYDGNVPPQRQGFPGPATGLLQEAANCSDDMKAVVGIYDSSLGARSNETSGRAILARQKESDISNFHFIDNLSRAIQYAGRVIVEIIPHVYKDRQILRILGEDHKEKIIKLGDGESADGEKLYNLDVGRYDVSVKAGPSYASQREETREALVEIMRSVPNAAPLLTDALLEHLDFVGNDKIAERAKMMLPPQIQQAEQAKEIPGMPKEAQQVIGQLQSQIQGMQQQLQQAQSEQAPLMAKAEMEKQKFESDAEEKAYRLKLEKDKFESETEEKAMKFKKEVEVDTKKLELDNRKLELEERKIAMEEAKVASGLLDGEKESKQQPMQIYANSSPEDVKADTELKGKMLQAVVSLIETQQAPIQIERDENGKIIGAARAIPTKEMEI